MAIYGVGTDESLHKIDDLGDIVWSSTAPTDQVNRVEVDFDGYIYIVQSGYNRVQKIDPSGTQVWIENLTGNGNSVAVDLEGNVFAATESGYLYKFDSAGNEVWSFNPGSYKFKAIAVTNDGYIYAAYSETIYKLEDLGTSYSEAWSFTISGSFKYGLATDIDNNIYIGDVNNDLYKYDSAGSLVWTYSEHTGSVNGVAVNNEGFIYTASSDGSVHKIDSTGTNVWKYTLIEETGSDVIVDRDGNVYAADTGTNEGKIHKINSTGSNVWTYTLTSSTDDARGVSVDPGTFGAGFWSDLLETNDVSGIKDTEATANGEIVATTTTVERGFVWDTISYNNPENTSPVNSNYTNSTNETGNFTEGIYSLTISGLIDGTIYYLRSYNKDELDNYVYGNEVSFTAGQINRLDTTDEDFSDGIFSQTTSNNDNVQLALDYTLEDTESFETDLGGWVNSTTDVSDWQRNSGGTGSSGTGASSAYDGTYYIYVETSSGDAYSDGDETIIEYDLVSSTGGYLDFYYHQYGNDQGTLYLEGYDGSVWTEIWSSTGDQGDQWNHVDISQTTFSGYSKLRFRNVAAGGYTGDVCLDLIKIYTGSGDYLTSGTYESATFSTSPLFSIGAGSINWNVTLNGQSITVETNVSTDNGTTWEGWKTVSASGDSIPDITNITDTSQGLVKYRVTFSSDGTDTSLVYDVEMILKYSTDVIIVTGSYIANGVGTGEIIPTLIVLDSYVSNVVSTTSFEGSVLGTVYSEFSMSGIASISFVGSIPTVPVVYSEYNFNGEFGAGVQGTIIYVGEFNAQGVAIVTIRSGTSEMLLFRGRKMSR